jgi:vacuolar-type H+-ATPase catalytic subunit A/Vma1
MNQIVRWVNNKDEHADQLTDIVTYYFLAQRIKIKNTDDKSAFADYQKKLTLLHQIMVYSMKAKQTTDLKNTEQLRTLIDEFSSIYFTKKDKKHLEGHKEKGYD